MHFSFAGKGSYSPVRDTVDDSDDTADSEVWYLCEE